MAGKMVKVLDGLGIIKPYHPTPSLIPALLYNFFARQRHRGRRFGQYTMGNGERAIFWTWELDFERECLWEFHAVDFSSLKLFKSWAKKSWPPWRSTRLPELEGRAHISGSLG
jgi:hypothetical protein